MCSWDTHVVNPFFPNREQVLTGTWTPSSGVEITDADLPDPWLRAIHRLSRDLHVRQYSGLIEHIDWVAEYDPDGTVDDFSLSRWVEHIIDECSESLAAAYASRISAAQAGQRT